MNLVLSRQAQRDIRSAAQWYDKNAPHVTGRFLNAIGDAFDIVREAPHRWPLVQGLPPNRRMRYHVMASSDFDYTIVYQQRSEEVVEVVAVAHHKRQERYWAPKSR